MASSGPRQSSQWRYALLALLAVVGVGAALVVRAVGASVVGGSVLIALGAATLLGVWLDRRGRPGGLARAGGAVIGGGLMLQGLGEILGPADRGPAALDMLGVITVAVGAAMWCWGALRQRRRTPSSRPTRERYPP